MAAERSANSLVGEVHNAEGGSREAGD